MFRKESLLIGEYERSDHATFDEIKLVYGLEAKREGHHTMVDVGAHFGGSLLPFLKDR